MYSILKGRGVAQLSNGGNIEDYFAFHAIITI